jgi:hypothetical protein
MAIAFVGAASAGAGALQTITCTYAPTSGNAVCLFLQTFGTVTAITVKDSAGSVLTAGPTVTMGTSGVIQQHAYFYTAGAGVTSFNGTWTGSKVSAICLGEYSGVSAGVNGSLTGYTATGSSATISISPTTQDNNDWIVAFTGISIGTVSITAVTVGNLRISNLVESSVRCWLADNTSPAAGAVTVTELLSGVAAWAACALELRVTAGVATANNHNQLTMVGVGT